MPMSKKCDARLLVAQLRKAIEDGDDERTHQCELAIEFGRHARPGYELARTIFGKVFEEREGTPFTCSPQSETYWCS